MCLIAEENTQVKTTEKNIIVSKLLDFNNRSIHTNFKYKRLKKNKKEEVYPQKSFFGDRTILKVDNGYHSWINPNEGNDIFIIPKGSKYIEGLVNGFIHEKGYVSSNIIYIGKKDSLITKFLLLFYK